MPSSGGSEVISAYCFSEVRNEGLNNNDAVDFD